jgi:hypothetical protein
MAVTNLKGATIKFHSGVELVAPNYLFTKWDAAETIMKRESLNAANYPYPTVDREGKKVEGSIGFESVTNLKSGTLTLGGSPVGHNFTKFEMTDSVMRRDSMNVAYYPYVTRDVEGKKCTGSVECELVDGTAFPDVDVDSVALVVAFTGFGFSGTVRLQNLKLAVTSELASKATISFDFETVSGTYTFTTTSSGLQSIHQVSLEMEVVGSGFYFDGNVELNDLKVSASAELGSKTTIEMNFMTVDGDYEFAEEAA